MAIKLGKNWLISISLVFVLSIVSFRSVSAATHVVDNTPPCCTGSSCYSTIQSAVNAASSGDDIIVCPGTYTENIEINGESLDISSDPGNPSDTIVTASATGPPVFSIYGTGAEYTNITGLKVRGATTNAGIEISIDHITISSNTIIDNDVGIVVSSSDYAVIEDNNIIWNDEEGSKTNIALSSSNHNTIRYNTISNGDTGIYLDSSSDNIISYNNILDNSYNVYNYYSDFVNVPHNWWGTTSCSAINSNIFIEGTGNVYVVPPLNGSYPNGSPIVEVCNGIDDDCDGTPDEEPEASASCPLCQNCSAGSCSNVQQETDPKEECPSDACKYGYCNGAGACAMKPSGTDCGTCASCNGLGSCIGNLTQDGDCEPCLECSGLSACSNVPDGTDPKYDCGEGCQRCVSGSCQDWNNTCDDVFSDYYGICGWQVAYADCVNDVCDQGIDYWEVCNPWIAYLDNTTCWTFGLEHCSQICGAECEKDNDCPVGEKCSSDCTCSVWAPIYSGTGGYPITDFAAEPTKLYAASHYVIYVYNGTDWSTLDIPFGIPVIEMFEGKLFSGSSSGKIYYYDGTWHEAYATDGSYSEILGVFDNKLYASTYLSKPSRLYYCDANCNVSGNWHEDTDFSSILECGGPFCSIDTMEEYDGKLYVTSGGIVYVYDTSWSKISYPEVGAYADMKVFNGKLYLATRDANTRCPMYLGGSGFCGRVLEYDGTWHEVFDHDYWMYSLEEYNGRLYAGTANKIYMTEDGSNWQLSWESSSGAEYAIALQTWNNRIYAGLGNGVIVKDDMIPITMTITTTTTTTTSTTTIPPQPDLVIEDIWNSGNYIYYKIKNQGSTTASYSYSRLYVDDYYRSSDYVSTLTAGYSRNEYFSYTWSCSGTSDSIKVCADNYGYVSESNENNNCMIKTLTCPVSACTCTTWRPTGTCCANGMGYQTRTCTPKGCNVESRCYGPCLVMW